MDYSLHILIMALFGHVAGDYFCQTKAMALNKSLNKDCSNWRQALLWSVYHSITYAIFVCIFIRSFDFTIMLLVFLSHWPVDVFSLADKWLGFIKGRTFKQAMEDQSEFRGFNVAFTAIVYTVVDNTMHLFLLYLIIIWGLGEGLL